MRDRIAPRLRWIAIAAGVVVATVIAWIAHAALAPIAGLAATIAGVAVGALLAGKWADSAGLQHGVMVAVGYIVLEAVGLAPSAASATDLLADTATVIAVDVLMLLVASAAGHVARPEPSSSSGTGTGR